MKKRLQRGTGAPPHSVWLRTIALSCLCLIAAISTAQAAHFHGKLLPNKAAHVEQAAHPGDLPGGEEKCPLCVAMHSGFLPVTVKAAPVVTTIVLARVVSVTDRLPDNLWHYAQFSRPPPQQNS